MGYKSIAYIFDQLDKLASGAITGPETVELFQYLVDSGMIWQIPQLQPTLAELLRLNQIRLN